jgi:hypothetical protein
MRIHTHSDNKFSNANNLQSNLNRLVDWCIVNDLSINTSKCIHITLHFYKSIMNFKSWIYNEKIIHTDQVLDLGIIFSNDLSFNSHIQFTFKG